ncbi:MAG: acetylxylan esterase [Rectinemataceae bacterium]
MPIVDLPLEELKTYVGRNPCPADFDAYWEEALGEMRSVDPQVEIRPAAFECDFAECFDLFFTGVRGARVHAKYLRPTATTAPHPALLQFHGYSGHSGDWSSKLGYVAAGFSVAAMDCRGQGGLSEDRGGTRGNSLNGHIVRGLDDSRENLLYRQIFLDTAQLASLVMAFPEVDAKRVGAMGLSQGGALTLACAALEQRITCLAPVYPFLSDYQRVWEMDLGGDAYKELREHFRRFDPTHARESEIFGRLGYIDVQHLAPRIRGSVLFFTGLMDTICPPSSQFAAYNRILAPKTMVIYPDFGHEALPEESDRSFAFMRERLGRK